VSAELVRYLIAGVVNTLAGYLVFLGALRVAGLDIVVANVLSYAAGLMVAFVLNRAFVFKDSVHSRAAVLKFLAGFAVAFAVNSGVLRLAHGVLGLRAELAQLCAMAAYTITFYLINKHVVFAGRRGNDPT
jgi:putative flippase GtrA